MVIIVQQGLESQVVRTYKHEGITHEGITLLNIQHEITQSCPEKFLLVFLKNL